MSTDEFSVAAMLAAAQAEAGLNDFGDDNFIEPFERLVESLKNEADLSSAGIAMLRQSYINLLVNRLRFENDVKKHPEILDEAILPPIAVMGLPRTGTTKMQRVLGAHPGLQGLRSWQLMNPAPLPDSENVDPDPRIAYAEAVTAAIMENHPDLLAGHPVGAMDYDEETCYFMEMTFASPLVPVRARVPSFTAWYWQQSMVPSYRYLRRLLQYIQWQQKSATSRSYFLKSSVHLGHIADFAEVFPGTTVVHCHRDPLYSVPSFAKLVEGGWQILSNIRDGNVFGDASLEILATHMARYLQQRPAVEDKLTFVDVDFNDIVSNPIAAVANVLERRGDKALTMTPAIEQQIQQWEKDNPATKFGKHKYTLEQYGLSEARIRERFRDYYLRFLES